MRLALETLQEVFDSLDYHVAMYDRAVVLHVRQSGEGSGRGATLTVKLPGLSPVHPGR